MVLFHHVPSFIPKLLDGLVWHGSRDKTDIFLTFDDGPVPGATDFVLDQLQERNMKATFFMVGDNIRKHPELARSVLQHGHGIGNHTYHHVDGFRTSTKEYLKEVESCQEEIFNVAGIKPILFRPPYGRLTPVQYRKIAKRFKVVMWDVISGDYGLSESPEVCLQKTIAYTRNGSIILFHDQEKTEKVIRKILPDFLDFIQDHGFKTALL